jgi:hypothetical protein
MDDFKSTRGKIVFALIATVFWGFFFYVKVYRELVH